MRFKKFRLFNGLDIYIDPTKIIAIQARENGVLVCCSDLFEAGFLVQGKLEDILKDLL